MITSVDIDFPHDPPCKKCKSNYERAHLKGGRWGIYCKDCGAFIKWADDNQKAVIKGRIAYIEKQKEVAGLKWGGGENNI